jgi:hypothetical protein
MTINQEKQNSDIQSKASLDNIVQLWPNSNMKFREAMHFP